MLNRRTTSSASHFITGSTSTLESTPNTLVIKGLTTVSPASDKNTSTNQPLITFSFSGVGKHILRKYAFSKGTEKNSEQSLHRASY